MMALSAQNRQGMCPDSGSEAPVRTRFCRSCASFAMYFCTSWNGRSSHLGWARTLTSWWNHCLACTCTMWSTSSYMTRTSSGTSSPSVVVALACLFWSEVAFSNTTTPPAPPCIPERLFVL
ncbi:hypothetical protein DIPPA_19872 [Diplonema papillatum]|nr:hypothetical protein DIPPA_19872 [Diplonema papillatum]